MQNCRALAAAVVRRAIIDYRQCLQRYRSWDEFYAAKSYEQRELEAFFRSTWGQWLLECCDYGNGEFILHEIRKMAAKKWKGESKDVADRKH